MDYLKIKELYHSGIKNMKWGFRRYQNEDGTLTAEGKLRYRKESAQAVNDNLKNETFRKASLKEQGRSNDYEYVPLDEKEISSKVKSEVTKSHIEGAQTALNGVQSLTKNASSIVKGGNGKIVRKDYSNMTDQDLRDRVNRLSLESQYAKLSGGERYVKSGADYCRELLEVAGSVAGIGASAMIIAKGIKDLKK